MVNAQKDAEAVEDVVIESEDLGISEYLQNNFNDAGAQRRPRLSCVGATIIIISLFIISFGVTVLLVPIIQPSVQLPQRTLVMATNTPTRINPTGTVAPTNTQVVFTAVPTNLPATPTAACITTVTVRSTKNANIRNLPDKNGRVLRAVPNGSVLPYFGISDDSLWVQVGGQEWISKELVLSPVCTY